MARQKTTTGYQWEVLLPWRTLDLTPNRGDEVAFQIMVNTQKQGGRSADRLLWFPITGAAFDSRKRHRIRLAEQPDQPVTARAQVQVNFCENTTACEVFDRR